MTEKESIKDVDDPHFQQMFWKVERTSWTLLFIFLLISALGFTGKGYYSRKTAERASGDFLLTYPQFMRENAGDRLECHLKSQKTYVSIYISSAYLRHTRIQSIIPEPSASVNHGDLIEYRFLTDSSQHELPVIFRIVPLHSGERQLLIGPMPTKLLSLNQFVYP
jgi:hypothetical protein